MASKSKGKSFFDGVVYDVFLWVFTVVTDLFFREIHPRSTWRIPQTGPVLFVAAPHANQFIDPLLLMRTVRKDAKRRIAILIAEKSMHRPFIGFAASLVSAVPVGRALDMKKPAQGKIYLPDPEGDPTLVKGTGTDFTDQSFMKGGLLVLPSVNNTAANAEIVEIVGPNEIRVKKPFKGDVAVKQLTGKPLEETNGHTSNGDPKGGKFDGIKYSVAPHVDQSAVYDAVFQRLKEGGCIGIFPEGGSHDRTELLPLKAGVAIMALGALAENPDCGVCIVPVGMNYFHAHKFRSRCVIEFGEAIHIEPRLVQQYKNGDRRGATGEVVDRVYQGLSAVTTQAPDYDTLMLIQAVRRLYNTKGLQLPLPAIVELNRRLIKGYSAYIKDPRIVSLKKDVLDYNKTLFRIGVRDHQVAYAKLSRVKVAGTLTYRVAKLTVLSVAVLPGVILFSPIFILGKMISRKKAKEALAASSVKIRARDVMATWKVLVGLAGAPTLDIIYTALLYWWASRNRVQGLVPDYVPLWFVPLVGILFFPGVCYAALRFGEIGMDIFKSLRPLYLSLNPTSSNTLVQLRAQRERLQERITNIINELGPELFEDFHKMRIVPDSEKSPKGSRPTTPTHDRERTDLAMSPTTPPAFQRNHNKSLAGLPRNESFGNIGSIGMFASNPHTPNRSRSRTNSSEGFKLHGFSPIEKPDMNEVSKNLQAAMRERGRKRTDGDWEIDRQDDTMTTRSELEVEEAKKVV